MAWFGFSVAAAAVTSLLAFGGFPRGPALPAGALAFLFLTALIYGTGRRTRP